MIICVKCKVDMNCKKNGYLVRMGEAEIFSGDRYSCPDCGQDVITGFGKPIMPWDKNYDILASQINLEASYD